MKNIFFTEHPYENTSDGCSRPAKPAKPTADLETKDLLHKSYRETSVTVSLLQIMFQASTMQLYLKKDFGPDLFL